MLKLIFPISLLFITLTAHGQNTAGVSFCIDDLAPGVYVLHHSNNLFYGVGGSVGRYKATKQGESLEMKHAKIYTQLGYFVCGNKYIAGQINYNLFDSPAVYPSWFDKKAVKTLSASFEVGAQIKQVMFGLSFDFIQWSPQFKIALNF